MQSPFKGYTHTALLRRDVHSSRKDQVAFRLSNTSSLTERPSQKHLSKQRLPLKLSGDSNALNIPLQNQFMQNTAKRQSMYSYMNLKPQLKLKHVKLSRFGFVEIKHFVEISLHAKEIQNGSLVFPFFSHLLRHRLNGTFHNGSPQFEVIESCLRPINFVHRGMVLSASTLAKLFSQMHH